MFLYFLVISEYIYRIYAENVQKQHDNTTRIQHSKTTHIVLTNYTALCGLYRTAYAVLIGKQHNILAHTYISPYSMRKSYKCSMMILI